MERADKGLDFTGENIYIGMDTHLRNWRTTIQVGDTFYRTFSHDPNAGALWKYLRKNFPGGSYFSAYEASFGGFKAHRELTALGIRNIVVNPADIPTTDKERKQKEDARDSRKIAAQLSASNLRGIHVPSIESEGDRTLLPFRRTLAKETTRNRARVKSLLYYHGIMLPEQFANKCWTKNFIAWLEDLEMPSPGSRATLDSIIGLVQYLRGEQYRTLKSIKALSQQERYREDVALLTGIPGIALITAMTLLTEIEDISRFGNLDELCSYVGLVPMTGSTGDRESTGPMTKRSNAVLRGMVVESSWVAIRHDPALMLVYRKLIKRMPPTRAIVRIAKKMMNRVRYVLKNKKPYVTAIVQ